MEFKAALVPHEKLAKNMLCDIRMYVCTYVHKTLKSLIFGTTFFFYYFKNNLYGKCFSSKYFIKWFQRCGSYFIRLNIYITIVQG